MKALQTYFQCWLEIAKQERYQDKWLSDETIFRAIKAQFPSLEALGFNRGNMNKAISSYEVRCLTTSPYQIERFCRLFPRLSSRITTVITFM